MTNECGNPAHTRLRNDMLRFKTERNQARALAAHQAEVIADMRYQLITAHLTTVLRHPDDFLTFIGADAVTDAYGAIDYPTLDALAADLTRRRPDLATDPRTFV